MGSGIDNRLGEEQTANVARNKAIFAEVRLGRRNQANMGNTRGNWFGGAHLGSARPLRSPDTPKDQRHETRSSNRVSLRAVISASVVALGVLAASLMAAPAAVAGRSVDPSTLTPPPPPGATCQQNGRFVICHTFVDLDPVNEPDVLLPCGQTYLSGPDHRLGTRWYEDGVLVRRFVRQDVNQTLSLSRDGSGPTLSVTAHDSWWGLADPLVFHGLGYKVSAPGTGVIAVIAGIDDIEGNHHGVLRFIEDPAAAAAACDALT